MEGTNVKRLARPLTPVNTAVPKRRLINIASAESTGVRYTYNCEINGSP